MELSVFVLRLRNKIRREKFIHRESDLTEHGAGIITWTTSLTFFIGQSKIISRDQKLGFPLQSDNRKLPQSDIQALSSVCKH